VHEILIHVTRRPCVGIVTCKHNNYKNTAKSQNKQVKP
jgi:hypothetical protein